MKVLLETGRTHQIRVHMASINHGIVGDKLYGGRLKLPPKALPELVQLLQKFPRQALHAKQLSLKHPRSGEIMTWEAPLPKDFLSLLNLLQKDNSSS